MPDHYTLLYISDLAPGAPPQEVAAIARQSRANNERHDITGLLVFDGESFAQVLEGPEPAILSLLERLKADTRHQAVEVLLLVPVMKPRRFPTWRLGYLLMDLQEFGVSSLRGKRGPEALEAFNFMLPALDLDVAEAVPGILVMRPERP